MKNKEKQNKKGFSILELAIVLAIVFFIGLMVFTNFDLIDEAKLKKAKLVTASPPPVMTLDKNPVLWLETSLKDSVIYDEDGKVSEWKDLSYRGVQSHAVQSVDRKKPIFVEKAINGLPALQLDGDNDWLDIEERAVLFGNNTMFVVALFQDKMGLILGSDTKASNGGEGRFYFGKSASSFNWRIGTKTIDSSITVDSEPHIFAIRFNNTLVEVYIDGNEEGSSTVGSGMMSSNPIKFNIGSFREGTNSFFEGYVGEIISFDRVLSDAEMSEIFDYLSKKWSIELVE